MAHCSPTMMDQILLLTFLPLSSTLQVSSPPVLGPRRMHKNLPSPRDHQMSPWPKVARGGQAGQCCPHTHTCHHHHPKLGPEPHTPHPRSSQAQKISQLFKCRTSEWAALTPSSRCINQGLWQDFHSHTLAPAQAAGPGPNPHVVAVP